MLTETYRDELVAAGRGGGLDAVGVASAEPLDRARAALEDRKRAGLHAGMQFTYRNPARSTDPRRTLPSARAIVVGARSYPAGPQPAPRAHHGRVAWYATRDHYADLRVGLEQIAARLRADGWRAIVLADDNALVDREVAHRAGLGWFGKNANVLLPGRGSWFVLGSVLTDAELPTNRGEEPDGCATCTRCLEGCPTSAIVAPGVVDARRCLAWLVQAEGVFPAEHRVALGDRLYGCDECQLVCPINRRHAPPSDVGRAETRSGASVPRASGSGASVPRASRSGASVPGASVPRASGSGASGSGASGSGASGSGGSGSRETGSEEGGAVLIDVLALLAATDDELLARHGRWYIPDRNPRYLRRNALVVLGNTGDGQNPEVVATVRRNLRSDDALLQAHAVWAARRLGLDALIVETGASETTDAVVRAELESTTRAEP